MSCQPEHCIECRKDPAVCTNCDIGFDLKDNVCVQRQCLEHNCKTCTPSFYSCQECNEGYRLVEGKCKKECNDGRLVCELNQLCSEENKCEKCERDMVNIGQQCLCNDKTVCGTGQFCGSEKCEPCSAKMWNCVECSNYFNCTQCMDGYVSVNSRCVQKCGKISCELHQVCTDGECVSCHGSNINIGGECKCSDTQDFCPEGTFCGYLGCMLCTHSLDNCKTCTEEYECTSVIEPCDDYNCLMCERQTSMCSKCPGGYDLSFDQCSFKCTEDLWCNGQHICPDDKTCDLCPYNMRNQAGICTCGGSTCTDSQYCIVSERKCERCSLNMPNCRNCSDLKTCTEPLNTCTVANCVMCEQAVGKCSKCAAGYALTGNSCVQTCGSVQCHEKEICADGICKLCAVNEINVAGVCSCGLSAHCPQKSYCSLESECVACAQGCQMCNGSVCYSCCAGYSLKNGVCGKLNTAGIIAGSVVTGIVLIALVAGLLYYFLKYRKQREFALQRASQGTSSEVAQVQQDQMYI